MSARGLVTVRHPGRPLFAVLGAGNGGQAMAAHLASQGLEVLLFNRTPGRLTALARAGALRATGALETCVPVQPCGDASRLRPGVVHVTSSLQDATRARVLMVTVPASAHRDLATALAPYLDEGQVVVLNPGRTLGALETEHVLQLGGCRALPVVAEAQSLLYAARVVEPGHVHIFSIKHQVPLAALPAWQTPRVLGLLREVFPQFTAAETVLHTSLDNFGAVFHPAPVLLNVARIEGGETFEHYHQGITPAVARILDALDAERLSVAEALGISLLPARDWLNQVYGSQGCDLFAALQDTAAYRGIRAPGSLDTRYLWEDVPTGLVPLASLGELAWVSTPTMRGVIHLASLVHGVDYFRQGRTLARVGLAGMDLAGLLDYVREGREAA